MEHDGRLTTDSLLDGLRLQEDLAWRRFIRVYGPLVISWVHQSGLSEYDAEDVVQEVFTAAAKDFSSYRHDPQHAGSFRKWLWGITRNKVADHQRLACRSPHGQGGTTAHRHLQSLPERPYEERYDDAMSQVVRELAHRAMRLIRTDFQEKTWQAFWQTTVHGRPTRDVAEELGTSSNSVRQFRSRVLRRLREELGEDLVLFRPTR